MIKLIAKTSLYISLQETLFQVIFLYFFENVFRNSSFAVKKASLLKIEIHRRFPFIYIMEFYAYAINA